MFIIDLLSFEFTHNLAFFEINKRLIYLWAMIWIFLAFSSALFLGFYDISKKEALSKHAVVLVLFFCSVVGLVALIPYIFLGHIPFISLQEHLLIIGKAFIVSASWAFTFNAIARLPLSVTAPIRASAPMLTILIAVLFMGERPLALQWAGIIVTASSYFLFSIAGKREMGSFFRNPWVLLMFIGTLIGAFSGVYDKYLFQFLKFEPLTVQFWFNVYMTVIHSSVLLLVWSKEKKKENKTSLFQFHWILLVVGAFLFVADRIYFIALHQEDALVSVVTIIRRSNVIVGFLWGVLVMKELGSKTKFAALGGIITGLLLIAIS
ncbi:MAG: DMT family transporter [Synergistota bacterium]|jgi:transporter family protein|nr:DMT family transporter [Synergistota bacterium]